MPGIDLNIAALRMGPGLAENISPACEDQRVGGADDIEKRLRQARRILRHIRGPVRVIIGKPARHRARNREDLSLIAVGKRTARGALSGGDLRARLDDRLQQLRPPIPVRRMTGCQRHDARHLPALACRIGNGCIGAEALACNDDPLRAARTQGANGAVNVAQRLLEGDIVRGRHAARSRPGHRRHDHPGALRLKRCGKTANIAPRSPALAMHQHDAHASQRAALGTGWRAARENEGDGKQAERMMRRKPHGSMAATFLAISGETSA